MSKIYIGVGHGGKDSGAAANGLIEADINLVTALACQSELNANGVDTKISRTDRNGGAILINDKVKAANAFGAEYVVEIHYNAGGGIGSEVYYSKAGGKGKTLAQNILDSLVNFGEKSRGIKTKLGSSGGDYFGIIRDTNAPAVLVECGFVDSSDYKNFDTGDKQKAIGKSIAQGVLKTLGITENAAVPAAVPEPDLSSSIDNNNSALPLLKKGSKGTDVHELQEILNENGADLNVDSDFGPLTDAAVRAFQKKNNLVVDGIVGEKTWEKLNSSDASQLPLLKKGSKGADVRKLQEILNENGADLNVDSDFGPLTDAAVRDFQKKNGLKLVDGIVGKETWGALYKN